MRSLRRLLRSLLEAASGREVRRLGRSSFLLLDPRAADDAWFSLDDVLPSLLAECAIDLVLDAGANEGQFGERLRAFFAGELHSFEPVGATCSRLIANVGADERWRVHHMALGRGEGEATINVSRSSQMASLLTADPTGPRQWAESLDVTTQELVRVRRLDAVLTELEIAATRRIFLKLDTQGFDLEVLAGVGRFLPQVHLLLAELSVLSLYAGAPHWTKALETFEEAGFTVAGLYPTARDGRKIVEYDCLLVRR